MKNRWLLCLAMVFVTPMSYGAVDVFQRQWKDRLPKVPDLGSQVRPQTLPLLGRLRWYQNQKKWDRCIETSKKVMGGNILDLWIGAAHVDCLRGQIKGKGEGSTGLMLSFDHLKGVKSLLAGSTFKVHRSRVRRLFLEIAGKAYAEKNNLLIKFLNRHFDLVSGMTDPQKAKYFKIMGDVNLREGAKTLAGQNFLKSYKTQPSAKLEKELTTLGIPFEVIAPESQVNPVLSGDEDALWKRLEKERRKNRYVPIAKTGVRYLKAYPSAPRAEKASDNLLKALRRIVYKKQKRFQSLKRDVLKQLVEAPGPHLLKWARSIYGRGYYQEARQLADAAAKQLKSQGKEGEALLLAGKSSYYIADWGGAKERLSRLVENHPGQEAGAEGKYFLGLLHFRNKDFTAVVPLYEKFLTEAGCDRWELQIRYWLWRALKEMKSARARLQEDVILKKFPLTYYGIRVRGETTESLQTLIVGEFNEDMKATYPHTEDLKGRWARIRQLLANGWLSEVAKEIDGLPDPVTAEGFVLRAQLWSHSQSSIRTMMALRKAVDLNPRLLSRKLLKMAFPEKHTKPILKYGGIHELDMHLVLSVIRQESGFISDAVSSSNAVGLMQLVRITAKETAKWIRLKGFRFPESLYDPETNIRMGTHYMRRMIKKYKGIVPLAMSAYNVGPGNMDRWLRQRTDIQWETLGADVVDDMWMDELPWSETSFYGKAILRNFLLYKIIYKEEESLSIPTWSGAQSMFPYGKSI